MTKPRSRNNVSGPLWPVKINPPSAAPTIQAVVSGALAAATYFVRISLVTANGETLPGPESSQAILINNVPKVIRPSVGLVSDISIPLVPTGWNVYMSTTTGTETKQNGGAPLSLAADFQLPNTGLVAGTLMPQQDTSMASVRQRKIG